MRNGTCASPLRAMLLALAVLSCSSGSGSSDGGLPDGVADAGGDEEAPPYHFSRPAAGRPLDAAEIADFTRKLTGFWKQVDYFRWCSWHAHGLHASYDPSMPDYGLYWQDTRAIKAGDTITFQHYGGADNLMIRTTKVLTNACAGYLASGDAVMGHLVEQYAKGIEALFLGMVFGPDDEIETIMARAIFTHDHSYTTDDGRRVAVEYGPAKAEKIDWNAHTIPNPFCPAFGGEIWVRNMRSKDDLPHMFRAAPWLLRVADEGADEHVRQAARKAHERLQAFARDIVDHTYLIRTKESDGVPYVPMEEENPDSIKDLACLRCYDGVLPDAECDAKLATALLAYGDAQGLDCGNGISEYYEALATASHYFNYAIVRTFHLAAISNALTLQHDELARALFEGLAERVDTMMADESERQAHREWDSDCASFLVAAAATGLPLTADEARLVVAEYGAAVDHYAPWELWDLWDPAVPDGTYDYRPSRDGAERTVVRPTELAYLIEYCQSPWRNPTGAELIDCQIVLDPARWGE
ncbi:MAG: hypothetical protein JXR96_04440 [Deltaproteobacteria bacterium]|nr:hypothetical protein [Deltaproteobacteria bacterium]